MQGVQQYQPQLFYYFDMDFLIPKNNILRKIDKLIDMGFVRDLTKPYYWNGKYFLSFVELMLNFMQRMLHCAPAAP